MTAHHEDCWFPMETCRCQDLAEIERLQKRIEELDEQNTMYCGELAAHLCDSKIHHITDEQINAAITEAGTMSGEYYEDVPFEALEKLGIHRCEECGGRARGWIDNDPNVEGSYEAVCHDCNGRGWVRHE